MHAPKQIKPKQLADYLEVMSKAAFQAGISWQVVETKWPGIKEAFDNFDPEKIAKYSGTKMANLLEDKRVIRNHLKLEAIVFNAHLFHQALEQRKTAEHFVVSLLVMTVSGVAPADQNSVRAFGKRVQYELRVHAAGAHDPDDTRVGRVLNA